MRKGLPLRAGFLLAAGMLLTIPAAAQSDLPDAPGKEAVEKVCANCHELTVITQNRGSREHWNAIVDNMVSRGAEGADDELDQVVKYLTANFGPLHVNVNKATADDLVTAIALSKADADAIVQYRAKNGPFKNLEALKAVPGINAKKIEENKDSIEY